MSDVFLSYKHAQRQEARQLSAALSAQGWTVWWDWNIPTGSMWQLELDRELNAAGCVVVLWSADSLRSKWVLYEAQSGLQSGKLIQALLEPVQPAPEFAALQAVNLGGWEYRMPFHGGFDRLRAAIRGMLDRRAPLGTTRSEDWVRTSTESGDLLRREPASSFVARARPAPTMLLPPRFEDLVDRGNERNDIVNTLAERRGVSLAGEPGSGKSALLFHVGNLDLTGQFHDGIVYLQAATQGANDLAQAVYEAFYDVAPGYRPSAVELRRGLADKTALLIVDDVEIPAAGLDALSANAPGSAWVLASEQVAASTRRRPVVLKGLPLDEGIVLFERALWRKLAPDERDVAARIVQSVQGHPARIVQAAGVAAADGAAAALAAIAETPNVGKEDSRSRRVLAALACSRNVPLQPELCAAIADVDGVDDVLAALMRRGLVQHVPPGFRLAAGVAASAEATADFAACRERATRAFLAFAFEARGTPRSVARLAAPMTAQMAWAAAHHRSAEALQLARALEGPLADANRWDAWGDVLSRAYDIAARAGDSASAGWARHQQGTRALMQHDKRAARRLLGEARKTRQRSGDTAGLSITRNNLRLVRWSRWAILLTLLGGAGLTTLGATELYRYIVLRPIIVVGPKTVDFGPQDIRAEVQAQTIQIANDGRGTLELIGVSVHGPNARSFSVGPACDGMKIPPKLACRVLVHFTPDGVGPRAATVLVRARDIERTLEVPVSGIGTAAPVARLDRETVDFGQVEIGSSANRRLMLGNAGSAALTPTAVALEGDPVFAIVRNGCKDAVLEPERQCAIDVRFAPADPPATARAQLVITDNASGSPRAVTLSGAGHETAPLKVPASVDIGKQEVGTQSAGNPAIRVAPARVDFGVLKHGAPPKPAQLSISNAGTDTLVLRSPRVEGDSRFSLKSSCPGQLARNASCTVDIGVDPFGTGKLEARVVIEHNASGSPAAIPLVAAIEQVPPPIIDSFVANPPTMNQPGQVGLCFQTRYAQTVTLDPGASRPPNPNGCVVRPIAATTTFTLTASGEGGSVQASAKVVVAPAPPKAPVIVYFRAQPDQVKDHGQTRLCFQAQNAESAFIAPAGQQPSSANGDCVLRRVDGTTTFTLTVTRQGAASQSRAATVTAVNAPPPPVGGATPPQVKTPAGVPVPPAGTPPPAGPAKAGEKNATGSNKGPTATKGNAAATKAAEWVGWCCVKTNVTRAVESRCTQLGGAWFGAEDAANKACRIQ